MDIPELNVSSRDREFKHYDRELRETIVIRYLFEGLSHRSLDEKVLGLDRNKSKGYQSWAILRHYGLGDDFKGIFKGMTLDNALHELPNDPQYDVIYDIMSGTSEEISLEPHEWVKGFTKTRLVKTRINQDKFRKAVLDAYSGSCCITGISEPRLLRASHIKPWRDSNENEKTDVCNGLCLNSLHDAAFDVGLMTIEPFSYLVRLSSKIEEYMEPKVYEDYFRRYDGMAISLPATDNRPKSEYLDYHKQHIFDKNKQYLKIELDLSE